MSRLREKTTATLLIAIFMVSAMVAVSAIAEKDYATIQDGTITDTKGNPITVGYDIWGYNYQAHMFYGFYDNYARPDIPVTEGTMLIMKWSDSWLSNKDRDFDTKLDRGNDPPYTSSAAEGAWLTNHMWGTNPDGSQWNYFVKIVYPGDDAVLVDGTWYTEDGVEIGPAIWGAYARILQISNDPVYDEHGVLNNWPAPAGFGSYK
jgi:hypothetical protein